MCITTILIISYSKKQKIEEDFFQILTKKYQDIDNEEPYLIIFLDPSCKQCKQEMLFLKRNQFQILSSYHICFISGVDISSLHNFISKYTISMSKIKLIADPELEYITLLNVEKMPTCFIYGAYGHFIQKRTGTIHNLQEIFL